MRSIRIATTNLGKLREFKEMLEPAGWTVRGVEDLPGFEVVEDGETLEANAIKKARALLERTGEAAVGDDSGVEVDALGGRPGIHSARYSGVDGAGRDAANRHKLLLELRGVPDAQRTARFRCALAYCEPGKAPVVFHGTVEGRIGHDERGEHGFGYDSLFIVEGRGRTAAELHAGDKHAISHRGRALQQLLAYLRA